MVVAIFMLVVIVTLSVLLVVFVFRPGSKETYKEYGAIPLRADERHIKKQK